MKGLIPILPALLLLVLAVPSDAAQSRTLTSVAPDHLATLENLHQDAVDQLLRNDFQAAMRTYEDILLLEPDDDTAYTGLGQIYLIQGQFKRAHDAFRSALEIDPDNEVALAGIQRIMDPDGVEGMVSTNVAVGLAPEEGAPPASDATEAPAPIPTRIEPIEPGFQAWARSKRHGAMRGARSGPAAIVETQVEKLHVQRVQMALKNAGHYDGPIDGVLGDATMRAVRDFQKKHGLENTGSVNVATWNALSGYLDAGR
jgi:tetratricopeptide (TPR) repeat protein